MCVCVGTYNNNNNNTVLPYEVMVMVVQLGSYGSYDCSASGVKSKVGWVDRYELVWWWWWWWWWKKRGMEQEVFMVGRGKVR